MIKEFKEFISKGNVIEMAVGLIMAIYFGAIIKSLVNDIIMPPVGLLLGGVDLNEMKVILKEGSDTVVDGSGAVIAAQVQEVAISYGVFINTILTFIIVALAIFLVVRYYNKMKRKMEKEKEEAPAAPPAPSNEEVLLSEIRDLLKK